MQDPSSTGLLVCWSAGVGVGVLVLPEHRPPDRHSRAYSSRLSPIHTHIYRPEAALKLRQHGRGDVEDYGCIAGDILPVACHRVDERCVVVLVGTIPVMYVSVHVEQRAHSLKHALQQVHTTHMPTPMTGVAEPNRRPVCQQDVRIARDQRPLLAAFGAATDVEGPITKRGLPR